MAKTDSKQIPGAGRTPEPERVAGIKVQALETGYYDHKRRREGDVFVIDGATYPADVTVIDPITKEKIVRFAKGSVKAFSLRWMKRVDPHTPERTTSAPEALKAAQDNIRGEKSGATGDQDVLG